jgi:hypothetical protein
MGVYWVGVWDGGEVGMKRKSFEGLSRVAIEESLTYRGHS